MTSRLSTAFFCAGIPVMYATSFAQEPMFPAGVDIAVVQAPSPDNREAVLDFTVWVEPDCNQDVLLASGSFRLRTSIVARVNWDQTSCKLVDPSGVEHCLLEHPLCSFTWTPHTIHTGFCWWQGITGGDPVYGSQITTHRVVIQFLDSPDPWVNIEVRAPDFGHYCGDMQYRREHHMFQPSSIRFYFDCRADFDGDGTLTIFDFLAFQNAFDEGDLQADFDGDGSLTIFDFLAFQNEFDAGC